MPYAEVMLAAIIPASLYYAALFIQVDLESVKLGVLGAPRDTLPPIGKVLREGWHFVIPFAVLAVGLVSLKWEPEYAALVATALLGLLAMTVPYRGKRLSLRGDGVGLLPEPGRHDLGGRGRRARRGGRRHVAVGRR